MKPEAIGSQRGGFMVGFVVGLLVGLVLALSVALYITKVPVPFVNKVPIRSAEQDAAEAMKNKDWDPNAPLAGKSAVRPSAAASGRVESGEAGTASTSPGQTASAAASTASAAVRGARDPAAILSGASAVPGAARSTAGATETFVYYVQAGAYSRAEDAEQQRARVGLLGLEARVTERQQSGRTVYRVRLGPFDRRDEAEAAVARLAEATIDANLVRAER